MSRVSKDAVCEPNSNASTNCGLSDDIKGITMDANTTVMAHTTSDGDVTLRKKKKEFEEGAVKRIYDFKNSKIDGSKVGHGNIIDTCNSGKSMDLLDALKRSYTPESLFLKLLQSGITDEDLKKLLRKKMLVRNLAFVLSNPQYNHAIIKQLIAD